MKLNQDIKKRIELEEYYTESIFINDCKCYINAVKSGRILYTVTHVSKSGTVRNINIKSYEGKMAGGYYRNYGMLLKTLGYSLHRDTLDIVVRGCGMNMIFDTNYNIIEDLYHMKFISKKVCYKLEQAVK